MFSSKKSSLTNGRESPTTIDELYKNIKLGRAPHAVNHIDSCKSSSYGSYSSSYYSSYSSSSYSSCEGNKYSY